MSEDELAREKARAEALMALRDPAAMARYCKGTEYHVRAHHKVIAAALAGVAGHGGYLMILCPPQVGKSTLTSRFFPLWLLARQPSAKVAVCSYGDDLAIEHGGAVRDLVRNHGSVFGLELERGSTAVKHWKTTGGGGLRSVGVGSGLTGFGLNAQGALIMDDLLKDRQDANSRKVREAVWGWASSTAMTRRAPGCPTIYTTTRWHHDDPAGRFLARDGRVEDGGRWTVVHLEAIYTGKWGPDPLGRSVGGPMTHPMIPDEDTEALSAWWDEQRRSMSVFDFGALCQGDPQPQAGAMLTEDMINARRWLRPEASPVKHAVAVDPSGDGDDACGLVAGFLGDDGRPYVTHDETKVMPSTEWPRAACELAARTEAEVIIVERNFGGGMSRTLVIAAWDALALEWAADPDNAGEPNPYDRPRPYIASVNAKKGKALRAEPIAALIREDRARFAGNFPDLEGQWTTWQPNDPDSPDNLDACVYLIWGLHRPSSLENAISEASDVKISEVQNAQVMRRPGQGPPAGPRPPWEDGGGPRITRGWLGG